MKLFVPGRLCLFGEHTDWAGHYRTMNADIAPGAAIVTGLSFLSSAFVFGLAKATRARAMSVGRMIPLLISQRLDLFLCIILIRFLSEW